MKEVIRDQKWLEEEFTEKVQKVRFSERYYIYSPVKSNVWVSRSDAKGKF